MHPGTVKARKNHKTKHVDTIRALAWEEKLWNSGDMWAATIANTLEFNNPAPNTMRANDQGIEIRSKPTDATTI
jgi:hypothetical protein